MNWNFRVLRGLARLTFAQQLILLALVPATLATLGPLPCSRASTWATSPT
jgi:hypothetical protein